MAEKQEGALSRWSRLKRGQAAESGIDSGATPREAPAGERAAARGPDQFSTAEVSPEGGEAGAPPVIREEDLPDIDSLDYESDFTVFLQEGVPSVLRHRALAKLWRSNPVLANVDGLNDYDLDYTIKEFEIIASESAEDLRSGKKRESAHQRRRAERDRQREIRRGKTARKPEGIEPDRDAVEERNEQERETATAAVAAHRREGEA